jgi:hypothetical protein
MVYAEYGIAERSPGQFEVDHSVPLELGGSNDIANLWPEAAELRPGFHEKDQVENYLHDQVCAGSISLLDGQRAIARNWLDVYQHLPQRVSATTGTVAPGSELRGQTQLYNLPETDYYVRAVGFDCDWTITLSPLR